MNKRLIRFAAALLACLFGTGCDGIVTPAVLYAGPREEIPGDRIPDDGTGNNKTVELTLVTYNVANMGHGGNQTDNIVQFIKGSGANLVGLNELDSCNGRHNDFQLKILAEKLGGWSYHFGNALDFAGGGYGNGALSDKPVMSAVTVPIPKGSGHEPRSIALIETDDIVFGAVHLDFGPPGEPSYEQAVFLNNWFSERYAGYDKPVILCGDFNTDPGTDTQNEMEKCWTRLSEPVLTWPTGTSTMCLDYVFCYKGAVQVEALETARATGIIDLDAASDHYPVRVKIRFQKNTSAAKPDRGVPEGSVKVASVSLYGSAVGNAMVMSQAKDLKGLPVEGIFDTYIPSHGGTLVVCDDLGNHWLLDDNGRITPSDGYNTIPAANCEAIMLRIDFGRLTWETSHIQKVELQAVGNYAEPVEMTYNGNGEWRSYWFVPADGYSHYVFRVYSDNTSLLYAWIRCSDGTLGSMGGNGETAFTENMAFTVTKSLLENKVVATVNPNQYTQQLKKYKQP